MSDKDDTRLILFVDGEKQQAILRDELSDEIAILKNRGGSTLDYEIGYDAAGIKANNRIATLERELAIANKVAELACEWVKGCPWSVDVKYECPAFESGTPCKDRLGDTGKQCWQDYFKQQAERELKEATDGN